MRTVTILFCMEKPLDWHSEKTSHLPTWDFSSMLAQLLHFSTQENYIQKVQDTPRYNILSPEEQSCVDNLLTMSDYPFKTGERTARNHRRLDLWAWLIMSSTPLHPQTHQIVRDIRNKLPLLLSTEDRKMLEHLFHIHNFLSNHDAIWYEQYVASTDPEKQSLLIQTYKQMIIAQTVHPNGTSSYFPYLPSEKTVKVDPPQTPLPDNDTFYQQLTDPTNTYLVAPQSNLQKIFHDIVLLSSMAQHVSSADMFQQLIHCRAHPHLWLISNEKYASDMFYLGNTITDSESTKTSPEKRADTYMQHSYSVLQDMHTAARSLLTNRAQLHHTTTWWTTYTTADHSTLQQIRETIQTISNLHGRIDLHYFIRHLPSESDEEGIYISSPAEEINQSTNTLITIGLLPYALEKELLVCSSERQYALMSTVLFLDHRQKYNIKLSAHPYVWLNNHSKETLQPIKKTKEQRLANKTELMKLLAYILVVPTTTAHITHGRVLKRIRNQFAIEDRWADMTPWKTYCLPVYKWTYIKDAIATNPWTLLTLLEQLRSFIYTHASRHHISLYQHTKQISTSWTQQLSITGWCYRVVDYLRLLYATDKYVYTTFREEFMNQINRSSATLHLFFEEQHKTITTHAHTE